MWARMKRNMECDYCCSQDNGEDARPRLGVSLASDQGIGPLRGGHRRPITSALPATLTSAQHTICCSLILRTACCNLSLSETLITTLLSRQSSRCRRSA